MAWFSAETIPIAENKRRGEGATMSLVSIIFRAHLCVHQHACVIMP